MSLQGAPGRARHPALITGSVMLATILYSIDWTIAVVALPHMQGTFSATHDQISWVITSYIVASAIMIPTAGWLSLRYGRKRVFMAAIAGFMLASLLCGIASSLAAEVLARILQGACGAFLVPLSQAIILDTYPPAEQGRAMALWGIGAVMGPVIGPTLGGYLTEYLTWRYIFYINIPFGLLALAGTAAFVEETVRDRTRKLDVFGFLTLALGVGMLQMMLDRGQRFDWFESREIVIELWLAGLGLYLFIAHILTTRTPFLDPRLFANRNFAIGILFVFVYGFITVPPMVLMPPFLQDLRGYPIDTIGLLQSPRGVGLLVAMLLGGRLTGVVGPRKLISFGLACMIVSSAAMSEWNLDVGAWPIVWTGFLQGVGAGIILVPIQALAFPSLDPAKRTEAAAVFNLVRSIGSSIGVSIALTIFTRTATMTRARLVEHVSPYNELLQYESVARSVDLGSPAGLAHLERQIMSQAELFGYTTNFRLLAIAALAGLPLLLLIGRTRSAPVTALPVE
jgi:MFS transporter, DHA2 family, multidrug resistance protein